MGGPDPGLGGYIRRRRPQHRHRFRHRKRQVISGHTVALPRPLDPQPGLLPPLRRRHRVRRQTLRPPLLASLGRLERRRPGGQIGFDPPLMRFLRLGQPLRHRGIDPELRPQSLARFGIRFGAEERLHLLFADQLAVYPERPLLAAQPPALRLTGARPGPDVVVLRPTGHLFGQVLVAAPGGDDPDTQHAATNPSHRLWRRTRQGRSDRIASTLTRV